MRLFLFAVVGLVSVGCGPSLRFGNSLSETGASREESRPVEISQPVVNVHNHMDLTPIKELVLELRKETPEARPDVLPDAQHYERTPMDRKPEPFPEPKRGDEPVPAPAVEEPATPFFPPEEGPSKLDKLTDVVEKLAETVAQDIEARKSERTVKTVAKSEQPKAGYTGAVIWSLPNCPPGDLLKAHLRGRGWNVLDTENNHFWVRPSRGYPCPTVEYFSDGKSLGTITGYGGTQAELDAIDARHPLRTPPRNVPAMVLPKSAMSVGDQWGEFDPQPFGPAANCAGSRRGEDD